MRGIEATSVLSMYVWFVGGAGIFRRQAFAGGVVTGQSATSDGVTTLFQPPEEIDNLADNINKEELSNQEHCVAPFPVAPDTALGSSSLLIGPRVMQL